MTDEEAAMLRGELRATQTALSMLIGVLGTLAAGQTGGRNPLLDQMEATLPGVLAGLEAQGEEALARGYERGIETIARLTRDGVRF